MFFLQTAAGTVEARVVCFYRRRDLSSSLIAAADKHHSEYQTVYISDISYFMLIWIFF
jgi:hypothetical protein